MDNVNTDITGLHPTTSFIILLSWAYCMSLALAMYRLSRGTLDCAIYCNFIYLFV